jgi:hypothetical protein
MTEQTDVNRLQTGIASAADRPRHFQPDPAAELAIVARWREASPAEHGRVLWGLLEFADRVQSSKAPHTPEPLRRLPDPVAEVQGR